MRKQLISLIAVMLLAVVLSACGTAMAQSADPQQPYAPPRTLNVNGSAQVSLAPDIAYINIGVQTENANAVTAVSENNTQVRQLIDSLQALGVAEKDIRTSNFSIYPIQDYSPEGEIKGVRYMVNNTVYVTLRDLTRVGEILNSTVSAGANSISGITFDVADKSAALTEARSLAIDNAKTTALEIADAAGVTLGQIQNISFYGSSPSPVYDFGGARAATEMDVPISTGEMMVSVEVTVIYEIR